MQMSTWSDVLMKDFGMFFIAAIEIAAARTDAPFDLMLPLLAHEGAAVRSTVLAALPTPLPKPLALSLLDSVKGRSDRPGPAVLVALGRGAESPEVERYLCDLLDATDPRARIAVLNALGQKPGRLRDPGTIRALICDSTRSSHERAVGVYCLERTGTLDRLDELLDMRETDPVIQYALGRCLVHELDPRGYPHLLELIEAKTSSVPEQLLTQVQLEARILVGRLSGQGQYASLERLHEWQQTARAVVPMPLGLSALGRS